MDGSRVVSPLAVVLLLTAGCTGPAGQSSSAPGGVEAESPPKTTAAPEPAPSEQDPCRPEAVEASARRLIDAVNAAAAPAVVEQFTTEVHWDVYLTLPNGGELRSEEQIQAFLSALQGGGVRWRIDQVLPPSDDAGLPAWSVYGVGISIEDSDGVRTSSMKLVADCVKGGILKAAGPES